MAMVIALLIAGVVSATYFASLRVWRRCSAQSQADPPAHMTIDRLTKELKNAYEVTTMGSSSITFTLPLTDEEGINVIPLQPGKTVSYYLAGEDGLPDPEGTVLWRQEYDHPHHLTKSAIIAENVESLALEYEAASPNRVLSIYALSITVVGEEGRQEYRSEFGSHVAFRN